MLNAKDVLICKVSVDREVIREGQNVEILFSFKSFFTSEILLVVDESSIVFNYQDVGSAQQTFNADRLNSKELGTLEEDPESGEMVHTTEKVGEERRIGVVTPRRETIKMG